MAREIDPTGAKCTKLSFEAPVAFGKKDREGSDFIIEAYTGEAVSRWWGKLAIAVEGIKAKKNIPVFRSHDSMNIVGFSTDSWKEGSFFVSGKFSKTTQAAQEVRALAEEGFPWQASIGVSPLKILSIENGETHEVNGKKLMGPAEVWLESEVYETSFVPLGADGNTSIAMLTRFEEEADPTVLGSQQKKESNKMDREQVITVEALQKDWPDIYKEILAAGQKEGAQAERDRIKAVRAQTLSGHEALIEAMVEDGVTTGEQAAARILQAEQQLRRTAATDLAADADAVPQVPASAPPDVEPDTAPTNQEGLKAAWDKDKALREEFGNDFEAYTSYQDATNQGLVKILKK